MPERPVGKGLGAVIYFSKELQDNKKMIKDTNDRIQERTRIKRRKIILEKKAKPEGTIEQT